MSRSIYFELSFMIFMLIFIRDIKSVYIVTTILLVYSYLKRYFDKKDIFDLISIWTKHLKKEKYFIKDKKITSIKTKKLKSLFEHVSKKEKEKSLEIIVASERMEALKNQLLSIVENNEESLGLFLRDIKKGIDINEETAKELMFFKEEFKKLIEINITNFNELEEIGKDNIQRKNKVNENIRSINFGIEGTNSLANKILELEKQVPILTKSLVEVKSIVNVVEKVVKKTELLSLNASIEASKAGETGKGFAVVAGEIINLANESRSAIVGIEEYIALLNNEIEGIVDIIISTKGDLGTLNENNSSIVNSLNSLENEFDLIGKDLKSIKDNSYEEKEIVLKVQEMLEEVYNISISGEEVFKNIGDSVGKQKKDLKLLIDVTSDLESATLDIKKLSQDIDLSQLVLNNKNIEENLKREQESLYEFSKSISFDNYGQLESYLTTRKNLEAIWIIDLSGNFVISIPKAGINNGRTRPWFYETLKNGEYKSEVYVSAISKKPCITIATCIYNNSGNSEYIKGIKKVEGVLAIDISLE